MNTTPRTLILGLLLMSATLAARAAEPTWFGYGGNAQHTALSTVPALPIQTILWQTPVDQQPQYSGSDLFIHYASPMATAANTILAPVKTGVSEGFSIYAFDGNTAAQKWSLSSDYILPPHGSVWTPSFPATLTATNRLYFAGAGGTVYYVDNPDANGATVTGQFAFYGLANYQANKSFCDANIFISSPLTSDSAGNIYFSFVSTSSATLGLVSGLARLAGDGSGISVTAQSAGSGDGSISKCAYNCAPALSSDGTHVYVLVSSAVGLTATGRLAELDAATLTPIRSVTLLDPKSGANAYLPDDGTASPVVGPDGDVYMGVLDNALGINNYRGWLLHFSGDLQTQKATGGFGWDDSPSIVPASMVPSYAGTSTYLLAAKYNNYAGVGTGNGQNKLAILDPNATHFDPISGQNVMTEVLTILGPTLDAEHPGLTPPAVREWCINSAVVDPATGSIYAGNEDGVLYQWNLTTNTFTRSVTLTSGIGEAYTPTLIGPNGVVYAINNATLFAVGTSTPAVFTSGPPPDTTRGAAYSFTCTASGLPAPVFSLSSGALPDGLSLNSSGAITGTSTKTGAFSGTFTATNISSNANQNFTILVNPTLQSLPAGKVGVSYAQSLAAASGLPAGGYSFAPASGSTLPPGLQISNITGKLSGVPTGSGTYAFTLKADDGSHIFTVPFTVSFAAPALALTPATLPGENVGTLYSQQFSVSGGTAPYTFAVKAGALPAGVTLSANGLLSGLPASEGTFTFTVQATDATSGNGPYSIAADYSVLVDYAPVFVSPPGSSNVLAPNVVTSVLVKNLTAQFSATVNPSDAAIAWNFGDGSAIVAGSPAVHTYAAAGTYTVTVTATNPRTSTSASATLSVAVDASAALAGTGPIRMRSGSIKLSARQNRIALQGSIDVLAGEAIAGAALSVGVNGVSRTFTLDGKGRAKTADSSAHLSVKSVKGVIRAQSAAIAVTISGADLPTALKSGVSLNANGQATMVLVQFHLNGRAMSFIAPLTFKQSGASQTAAFGGK